MGQENRPLVPQLKNKFITFIIIFLISLNLTITILLLNVTIITLLNSTYSNQVEKVTGFKITEKDKLSIAINLKRIVLKNKNSYFLLENGNNAFTDIELTHLKDIANILFFLRIVLLISLLFSILLLSVYKKLINKIIIGTMILVFLSGLIIALTFSSSFILFHIISFNNNFWILNPETHLLINIFPESFFLRIFILLIITSIIELVSMFTLLATTTKTVKVGL